MVDKLSELLSELWLRDTFFKVYVCVWVCSLGNIVQKAKGSTEYELYDCSAIIQYRLSLKDWAIPFLFFRQRKRLSKNFPVSTKTADKTWTFRLLRGSQTDQQPISQLCMPLKFPRQQTYNMYTQFFLKFPKASIVDITLILALERQKGRGGSLSSRIVRTT